MTEIKPPSRYYHLLVKERSSDPAHPLRVRADTICKQPGMTVLRRGEDVVARIEGIVFAWWIEEAEEGQE